MPNTLERRLSLLEERAFELGLSGPDCRHWLHHVPEPAMLCNAESTAPVASCPGCGDERPILELRLVVV